MTREELFAATDKMAFCRQELNTIPNGKNEVPYCCHFHEDSNPSATFNMQSGLFNCHGCGKGGSQVDIIMETRQVDIAEAFRILETEYAGMPANQAQAPNQLAREVAVYPYTDENGKVLYEVVRLDPKGFRQRQPDGTWGIKGIRRVLYGLPAVLEAVEHGRTIYIVEGEKDADRINDHDPDSTGYVATTAPGGAEKWKPEYADTLAGADHIIIVQDKDDVGRKHSRQLYDALAGRVDHLEVVEARSGKDASDHLAAGHTLEDLEPVEMDTPEAESGLHALDLSDLLSGELEPIPWIYTGWLADRDVACIAGDSGVGKSWIALDLAVALASGRRFLDMDTGKPCRVMYCDEENNPRLIRYRLHKLANGYGIPPEEFSRLPILYLNENSLNLDDPDKLQALFSEVKRFKPGWIIMDSLVRFHRRNENDNSDMAAFIDTAIKPLATHYGAGVIFLHHLSKAGPNGDRGLGERLRGASDLKAVVDQLWGMEVKDGNLTLQHIKCRCAPESKPLAVTRADTEDEQGLTHEAAPLAIKAEELVVEVLTDARTEGMLRQDIIKAGTDAGIASRTVERAISNLHDSRKLYRENEKRKARYWLHAYSPGMVA